MPVEIIKSDSASAQIAAYIEQCRPFWPQVNTIRITRKRKGNVGAFEQAGIVRHVTNKENETIDDSKAVIEQFIAIGRADADANGAADYRIGVWGPQDAPVKGRRKTTGGEDAELLGLTVRLGDVEEAAAGEASLMREVASLLPKQAAGFGAAMSAAQQALELQGGLLQVQAKIIESTYEIQKAGAAQQTEAMRLLLDARKDERAEAREQERMEREDERAAAQEANRQQNIGMLMGFLTFVAQIASMKFAHETGQQPPAPPGGAAPQKGNLGPELAAVFSSLTEEETAKIQEVVGDRIWDLFIGASKAKTDDECIAILAGLKAELKNHPNGKMAMMQLVGILGQERMQRLAAILSAAGIA